jgi:glycosyltransferase involved in cell wall biosynthesis
MTISLNMIVKNEASKIKDALDSIQEYVDKIYITDTGSTDATKEVIKKLPYSGMIEVSDFNPTTNPEAFFEDGSIYNFAAARAFNFSQSKEDWIIWMDADDIYVNPKNIGLLINEAKVNNISGYFFDYWYQISEGKPTEHHLKLMLTRNNGQFEWKGNIHEDLLPKSPMRLAKTQAVTRVHKHGKVDEASKNIRNMRILSRQLQEMGDKPDPRTLFYMGRSLMVARQSIEAIPIFEKYMELSGWAEELYEARFLLAECYVDAGRLDDARNAALKNLELKPNSPDAYHQMARTYLMEQEYQKALQWTANGLRIIPPEDAVTTFPHRYTTQPYATLATTYLYMGKFDDAKMAIDKALSYSPKDAKLLEIQQLISYLSERRSVAVAYATIAGYMRKKKEEYRIATLIGNVPGDLNADPIIGKIRYDYSKPKTWPEKSIAILAFGTVEAWSPKNEKAGGIGGSEEAVLNLSRELNKLGYRVTVYTNTGSDDGVYDGVVWKMFTEFNGKDKFDTIVLWRANGLLEYEIDANVKLFDLHDVPMFGDWNEEKSNKVNKLMVKSEYHKSLFPEVKPEKIVISTNGINSTQFKKKIDREEFRCFYSSAIDRGLDILLDMWPKIKEKVPKATLHIYYGFQTFKALNKHNPERMRYVNNIEKKMNDMASLGVVYHGRVSHDELADEMLKSDVWLYPTYFPEISCITAMKAQAAGAIPVCTDYAALDETVQYGKKIGGDIYIEEIQAEFINAAVEVLNNSKFKKEQRKLMMPWAQDKFSWTNVAKEWDKTINDEHNRG